MGYYDHIRNMYFIGIGGIGMSALARYFKARGKYVSGYDRNDSGLVAQLREEGIPVITSDQVEELPEVFTKDQGTLVIYTPAIPREHPQYLHFVANGYQIEKRAVVLGKLTRERFTIAVAGTHGKTTTSTMVAHLLKESGVAVTAFLGGISENTGSNLIMEGEEVMVVEADEFDRSFLQISPNLAAITSMDADHLDIYGEDAALQASFHEFAGLVPEGGELLHANGLTLQGSSVGVEDDADISAIQVQVRNGGYHFDLRTPEGLYKNFRLQMPGKHNLQNAAMALGLALRYGISSEKLAAALASFKGVSRRFSYRILRKDRVLIDDYAHHPTEISAVAQAIREMHPGKKVLAVFQPHLFSRTRDFAEAFAESLAKFDALFLLDIYPAREAPIEGVTSAWLLDKIRMDAKDLVEKQGLAARIRKHEAEVIVMLGAGDIGDEVQKIKKELEGEN